MSYTWLAKAFSSSRDDIKIPKLLSSFVIKREVRHDYWNDSPNSDIYCEIFNDLGRCVGEFSYSVCVGQIGGIFLTNDLRNCMIEQQILLYMMREMQQAGATHIWKARAEDFWYERFYGQKPFYSLLWDFQYVSEWIHPSLNAEGYRMRIPDNINLLYIDSCISA